MKKAVGIDPEAYLSGLSAVGNARPYGRTFEILHSLCSFGLVLRIADTFATVGIVSFEEWKPRCLSVFISPTLLGLSPAESGSWSCWFGVTIGILVSRNCLIRHKEEHGEIEAEGKVRELVKIVATKQFLFTLQDHPESA